MKWPVSHLLSGWLLLVVCATGCKVMEGWRRMSYEELLYNSDLVVVGTDLRHVKSDPSVISAEQSMDSVFEVSCVLKGDGKMIIADIRIVAVYPSTSCLESVMRAGEKYIVGLERFGDGYLRHNVNSVQVVTFMNSTDNWSRALRVCGLQHPKLPSGTYQSVGYTYCQNPAPTGTCYSPITSRANSRRVTFGLLLVAFSLALWMFIEC